eukprot:2133729-Rhodomonas_salina.1
MGGFRPLLLDAARQVAPMSIVLRARYAVCGTARPTHTRCGVVRLCGYQVSAGRWVHVFPEGRVIQARDPPAHPPVTSPRPAVTSPHPPVMSPRPPVTSPHPPITSPHPPVTSSYPLVTTKPRMRLALAPRCQLQRRNPKTLAYKTGGLRWPRTPLRRGARKRLKPRAGSSGV